LRIVSELRIDVKAFVFSVEEYLEEEDNTNPTMKTSFEDAI
jgi:hypothetical protein